MKESFEKVYDLMKRNHQYSPWVQQTSLKDHAIELQKEVQEMIDELGQPKNENFRKELGDVFWDTLKLMVHAENEGWFSIKEMFDGVYEKISRRKPFIVEGKTVSLEEERKVWEEVKAQEKKSEEKNVKDQTA